MLKFWEYIGVLILMNIVLTMRKMHDMHSLQIEIECQRVEI